MKTKTVSRVGGSKVMRRPRATASTVAPTSTVERQELHCHACNRYVQFSIDVSLNGNHVLYCPNCGHEHCRVVDNGRITDVRWAQRNQRLPTYQIQPAWASTTTVSTYDSYTATSSGSSGSSVFLYQSWLNTANATYGS